MNAEVERIRALVTERERLIQREAEIYDLPDDEITPELEQEAVNCWLGYERIVWSDHTIRALLAILDAARRVDDCTRMDSSGQIVLLAGAARAIARLHDALAALEGARDGTQAE